MFAGQGPAEGGTRVVCTPGQHVREKAARVTKKRETKTERERCTLDLWCGPVPHHFNRRENRFEQREHVLLFSPDVSVRQCREKSI